MRHTGSTAIIETGGSAAEAIIYTGHNDERIFNKIYKTPTEKLSLKIQNKRLEAKKSQNNQ